MEFPRGLPLTLAAPLANFRESLRDKASPGLLISLKAKALGVEPVTIQLRATCLVGRRWEGAEPARSRLPNDEFWSARLSRGLCAEHLLRSRSGFREARENILQNSNLRAGRAREF